MTLRTVEMSLATPGLNAAGHPTRVPLGVSGENGTYREDLGAEHMLVNIGPQHPATHGVLRLVLELEGETVKRCIPHIGYLHSGFEKLGEYRQYNQIIPLTDRTDYLSPMANNVGLALAVEALMGLETHRALQGAAGDRLRDEPHHLASRLARHHRHRPRRVHAVSVVVPGARADLQPAGGVDRCAAHHQPDASGRMMADIPDGWEAGLREFTSTFPKTLAGSRHDVHPERHLDRANPGCRRAHGRGGDQLLAVRPDAPRQRRRLRRAQGSPLPRLRDLRLRCSGGRVRRHLRPLPGAAGGDDAVEPDTGAGARPAEPAQGAPINVSDPRVVLPPKSRAMSDMEAMIFHFKQVMEGVKPPAGEVYMGIENPKGELGYYMVSDGTSKPVRWRIRPPSFINLASLPTMCEGVAPVRRHRHQRQRGYRHGRGRPMSATAGQGGSGAIAAALIGGRPLMAAMIPRPRLTSRYSRVTGWPGWSGCLASTRPSRRACCPLSGWCRKRAVGSPSRAIGEVAEVLDLTPAYVKGVVTFYTMYHTHPVGRHFIQVCTTSPCNICGAEDVTKALLRETGCGELGATSPDGRFTVIEVECLGACGFATPILVDDDFIESVTPEKVSGILQRYK